MAIDAATGRARDNFSNTHLLNAHRFALRVHEVETANLGQPFGEFYEPIRADCIACVLSAVAALEAYLGEVGFEPTTHFPGQPAQVVEAWLNLIEFKPFIERLKLLALLNGKALPDFSRNPGQNVVLLVKLRNALVHYNPEWPDEQKAQLALGKSLKSKFPLSPFFGPSEPIFPRACMSYGCSKWAVETVRDFIVEYAKVNGWQAGVFDLRAQFELPT